MKFPAKFAPLLVVCVLSVAGLTAVTSAYGGSGHSGHGSWSGKHGGKHMCQRGSGGMHHGPKHGPDYLAMKLGVMETEIGIRANQIDAWRDFTDALLATMKRRPMGPGMGPGDSAAPFSLAEGFADRAIERADSAEKLKQAIATLRTTLTAEQLDKVKTIEARLRARFQQHHGGGHHGMGPHGTPSVSDEPDASGEDDTEDDE
ncbi:MAG: hypothetical protein ACRECX_14525 [Methyloceanibacter sp.]|uniref:hypothetical protein n=1 Tax=Methyloceanibacter sp. TaxID=1965321 RepID=UPI003D6D3E30